jgi:hypothetical protein
MRKKVKGIKDFVEQIDWSLIIPKKHYRSFSPDNVLISCLPADPKNPDRINQVRLRIGENVVNELGWEIKDKIEIFHDPDDIMNFKLTKVFGGHGFSLQKDSHAAAAKLIFRWSHSVPLTKKESAEVDYDIYKKSLLIFRLEDSKESLD